MERFDGFFVAFGEQIWKFQFFQLIIHVVEEVVSHPPPGNTESEAS